MTRIIGGDAGGRRINTPAGQHTRPTTDRVREALFSAVESWCGSFQGLRFLDLYAGSGAVGLEAWSRGAGVVTFVESDRRTSRLVYENAKLLGFHRAHVMTVPVASALGRPPPAPYDIVFSDPPYHLSDETVAGDLRAARRARLGRPRRHGRRRAVRAQPGAGVAGGLHRDARAEVRRDDALVRSRLGAPMKRAAVSWVVRPGHQAATSTSSAGPPRLFDEVVVAVGVNPSKNRLFGPEERIAMLEQGVGHLANVTVAGFTGLITTYCQEIDATAIVKGLRSGTDFDYEAQMAQMNAELTGVETVFVIADPQFGFVSSSLVKEVASFGGDVAGLVPDFVLEPAPRQRLAQVTG